MTPDFVEDLGHGIYAIDTPGHARSRGCLTGDAFGLSYREFDSDQVPWLLPTSTPVQFEP